MLRLEKVHNYGIGLKQQLFDKRLTLDLSAYWMILNDAQSNLYPLNGLKSYLANAGKVRARH